MSSVRKRPQTRTQRQPWSWITLKSPWHQKKASLLAQWNEVRLRQVGMRGRWSQGARRRIICPEIAEKRKKKQSWWYQFSWEVGQLLTGKGRRVEKAIKAADNLDRNWLDFLKTLSWQHKDAPNLLGTKISWSGSATSSSGNWQLCGWGRVRVRFPRRGFLWPKAVALRSCQRCKDRVQAPEWVRDSSQGRLGLTNGQKRKDGRLAADFERVTQQDKQPLRAVVREELFKGGFRWSKLQGVAVGMGCQGEGGRRKLGWSHRDQSLREGCSVG